MLHYSFSFLRQKRQPQGTQGRSLGWRRGGGYVGCVDWRYQGRTLVPYLGQIFGLSFGSLTLYKKTA
jgi:hypothetical protein